MDNTEIELRKELGILEKRWRILADAYSVFPRALFISHGYDIEQDAIYKRKWEIYRAQAELDKPRREAEKIEHEAYLQRMSKERDIRVRLLPIFRVLNSWEVVKDNHDYVIRYPISKEECYRNHKYKRVAEVAHESKPE